MKEITQLLLFQIAFFVFIVIILRFLFYRHLSSALKGLKKLHEENQIKESQLHEELERARIEREFEVEKGKEDAEQIINNAQRAGEIIARKLEDKGRLEADRLLARSKEESEMLKNELQDKSKAHALKLAIDLIEYTCSSQLREQIYRQLIGEIIEEIEKIEKDKFPTNSNKVKIISSYILTSEERDNLKGIFSRKLDCDVVLEEEVKAKDIIGGLIVEIGVFVIDGSFKNKLRKAIPFLKTRKEFA